MNKNLMNQLIDLAEQDAEGDISFARDVVW